MSYVGGILAVVLHAQEGGLEIEQVDGAGAGPAKKRKTGLDSFDADEDDDGGDLGGAAAISK
jgi:hypothetical protein